MKNIRLAIIRQKYRLDGGAERFIACILKYLDEKIISLNIITRQWIAEPYKTWNIYLCNPKKFGRISREKNFAISAKKCCQKEKFDLIQSHERIIGCDIYRAGDGVHRVWLDQLVRILPIYKRVLIKNSFYHRYVLTTENKMFNSPHLKKIICNSIMVREDIIKCYGVSKDKLSLIYNSVDSIFFHPADEVQRRVSREILLIPVKVCVLIYVGSGFRRKGLYQAISAVAATDRYLIIVGRDKYQYQYQKLAQSLGCLNRLRFVGIKKNIQLYYHASDAFILPTLYDPFPNAILESMSCGLPVITSLRCGGAEFIEFGKQGYICDALDINSLKEFISVIPKRDQDPNMGNSARETVINRTPKNIANQLMKLYRETLT